MARIRTIKPEFFLHEAMAATDPHARLLALGLLCQADRKGRLRWLSASIIGDIFPHEPGLDIDGLRRQLEAIGYIQTWTDGGKTYCHILNFAKHQRISGTELKAKVFTPEPPPYCQETTVSQVENGWKQQGASSGSNIVLPLEATECFREIGKGNRGTGEIGTEEKGKGKSLSCGEGPPPETEDAQDPDVKAPLVYPDPFLEFWKLYPVNKDGRKRGKAKCFGIWRRIPAADRKLLLEATHNYATGVTVGDGYVKDPERFLGSDFWRDYIGEAEEAPVSHSDADPSGNMARLAAFLENEQEASNEYELF